MKILIVGCGSIGLKYLSIINQQFNVGVYDSDFSKLASLNNKYSCVIFKSLQAAIDWNPNGAIICTPNELHLKIAFKLIVNMIHVLIEKPVSISLTELNNFIKKTKKYNVKVLGVCNMRFHPAIEIIKKNLKSIGKIFFVKSDFGYYLPHMRKNEDYKKLYVSKRKSGGIIFDAIHELDYLVWIFGPVIKCNSLSAKISNLDINSEDFTQINLIHKNNIYSSVSLDFIRKFRQRGCKIVGSKGTLQWTSEGKNPEIVNVRLLSDLGKNKYLFKKKIYNYNSIYNKMIYSFIKEIRGEKTRILEIKDSYDIINIAIKSRKFGMNEFKI